MIFVTVGAQLPFDRLVRAVDGWAAGRRQERVFVQIGHGEYEPRNVEWARFLSPPEFQERLQSAKAVVAHAGMGSILTALECGKPIVVLPRRADLREHRNDHQRATAEHFRGRDQIYVAMDEADLARQLDQIEHVRAAPRIESRASKELLQAIQSSLTR